jgi:hypothetical protein
MKEDKFWGWIRIMNRRRPGKWPMIILIILIGWPIYVLYDMSHSGGEQHDAARLLYQVSLFQIELLNSCLKDAAKAADTSGLEPLKQAVYSANFTHERFVLAMGPEKLNALDSLDTLMQYILRLQIGGSRPLHENEKEVFAQVSAKFKEVQGAYKMLLSSNNKIISSQNTKLSELNADLQSFLNKKLLE